MRIGGKMSANETKEIIEAFLSNAGFKNPKATFRIQEVTTGYGMGESTKMEFTGVDFTSDSESL